MHLVIVPQIDRSVATVQVVVAVHAESVVQVSAGRALPIEPIGGIESRVTAERIGEPVLCRFRLKDEGTIQEKRSPPKSNMWSETVEKERRHWSADEKTRLLRRHLIEKVPVSKICEEAQLAPSMFHRWEEQC